MPGPQMGSIGRFRKGHISWETLKIEKRGLPKKEDPKNPNHPKLAFIVFKGGKRCFVWFWEAIWAPTNPPGFLLRGPLDQI